MSKCSKTWIGGVNRLFMPKVPMGKKFLEIQKFSTEIDDAQTYSGALLGIKEKAEELAQDRDKVAVDLKQEISSIKSKLKSDDSARASLLG